MPTVDLGEPPPVRRWWPPHPSTAVAVLAGFAAWVWHAVALLGGYFMQDDFLYFYRAARTPPDWHYLFQSYSGNVLPGQFLLVWVLDRIGRLNYQLALVPVLALEAAALVILWRLLVSLFGRRPAILLPFLAFALSPFVFVSVTWWAYALELLPMIVAMLAAVHAQVRFVHTGRSGYAVAALGWTTIGILFWDKAILLPIVVFGVTVVLSPPPRLVEAIRRYWRWWLGYLLLVAGYVALYLTITAQDAPNRPVAAGQLPDLVERMVGGTFLPGLLGGPWAQNYQTFAGWTGRSPVVLLLVWFAVLAAVVLALCTGRLRALWALVLLVVYLAADVVLVAVARLPIAGPVVIGGDPRYTADAIPVAILCASLAFLAPRRSTAAPARIARRVGAVALAVLFVAGAVLTTVRAPGQSRAAVARQYVANASAALHTDPDMVLYDGTVPQQVMFNWFDTLARVSVVLDQIPHPPRFDEPTDNLRILDSTGTPQPVRLLDTVSAPPGPVRGCGYLVADTGTSIPLNSPAHGTRLVVRIGYYDAADSTGTVTAAGQATNVRFTAGLHYLYLVSHLPPSELRVRLSAQDNPICVTDVRIGTPVP